MNRTELSMDSTLQTYCRFMEPAKSFNEITAGNQQAGDSAVGSTAYRPKELSLPSERAQPTARRSAAYRPKEHRLPPEGAQTLAETSAPSDPNLRSFSRNPPLLQLLASPSSTPILRFPGHISPLAGA